MSKPRDPEIINLTPTLANKFLSTMRANRPVSESTVEKYALAIKNDEWRLNGEALKFDVDGSLIDGQHRCLAVINEEKPIKTWVHYDIRPDAFYTLDQGKRRDLSDCLGIHGNKDTKALAAALGWLYREKEDAMLSKYSPTAAHCIEMADKYEDMAKSVEWARAHRSTCRILPIAAFAYAHYRASKIDPKATNEFFERLGDGVNLAASSPIRMLRERLIKDHQRGHSRMQTTEKLALTVIALNHYLTGRAMSSLRWRIEDDVRVFPSWCQNKADYKFKEYDDKMLQHAKEQLAKEQRRDELAKEKAKERAAAKAG